MRSPSRLVHGHARKSGKTPEYVAWMKMRSRCNNANVPAYPEYGGRGIKVCARWDDFGKFLDDMGPRPSEDHSIDRIDPNGQYEPSNCRWASWKEQQRNRRNNLVVTFNGITATFAEHCERAGVPYKTAHKRLVDGASIEVAMSAGRVKRGTIKPPLAVTLERLLA